MKVGAHTIVHLGDNLHADQTAPSMLGVATAHFEQFDKGAEARLRLEAMAAVVIDSETRQSMPAMQPHRPLVSLRSCAHNRGLAPVWGSST